jgi:hypothetical protein
LDDAQENQIVEKLLPLYQQPVRENMAFACSGYLHKYEISEDSITKIINRLALETNDEEYVKRLQTVRDTCAKSRNAVCGHNKLVEVLTSATNNGNKAEEIVNSIGQILSQTRCNQGSEWGFESEGEEEDENDDLMGINLDILQRLSPHIYSVVSTNPPVMYVAHRGKRKIVKAVVKFVAETDTTSNKQNQGQKMIKQLLLWKQQLIFALPVKVIINDSPIDENKTYQITFTGRSKKPFTTGPGSISSIIDRLYSEGKVLKNPRQPMHL